MFLVRAFYVFLLFPAVWATSLEQMDRELMARRPTCNGRLVRRKINMEVNGSGKIFKNGQSVRTLPDLKVIAKRSSKNKLNPSRNDAAVTNYRRYGKVLILKQGKSPRPNPVGGIFKFDFGRQIHQLNSLRILKVNPKGSFIKRQGQRQDIRPGVTRLKDWFKIRRFRVKVSSLAYIAEIEYTICVKRKPPKKTTGTLSPKRTTTTTTQIPSRVPIAVTTTASKVPISKTAKYFCEFVNRWTKKRHPVNFPGDAHWSPPVILAHDKSYRIWKAGRLATPGARLLAELGPPQVVKAEAEAAGFDGMAIGSPQYHVDVQRQRIGPVVASAERPYLSSMSMIAPSPDWFTGMEAIDLRNSRTNTWFRKISVETFPYDAGTDNGETYRSPDSPSRPQEPIYGLTKDKLSSRDLLDPSGSTVLPVAKWECILRN